VRRRKNIENKACPSGSYNLEKICYIHSSFHRETQSILIPSRYIETINKSKNILEQINVMNLKISNASNHCEK
jgi:hypothetical protein